jgi:hypothetical protein
MQISSVSLYDEMFFRYQVLSLHFLTFAGSVAVSAMLRALLRTPTGAAGEKAATDPQRSAAIASFMIGVGVVRMNEL